MNMNDDKQSTNEINNQNDKMQDDDDNINTYLSPNNNYSSNQVN
jgi:hypothetical protein